MSTAYPIAVRRHEEADLGFIIDAWLRSYHDGSSGVRRVLYKRYKPVQRTVIADVLASGAAVVACDPDDGVLWGFAAAHLDDGEAVLDYVYTTHLRRRAGIARELVTKVGDALGVPVTCYSHHTVNGEAMLGRRLGLRFNPFSLVRFLRHAHHSALRSDGHPDSSRASGADPHDAR